MLIGRQEGNPEKQVELVTEGKTDGTVETQPYGKDANKIINVPHKLPTLHTPLL